MSLGHLFCYNQDAAGHTRSPLQEGEDAAEIRVQQQPAKRDRGLVSYAVDLRLPLIGPPLREADVWHLGPDDGLSFRRATLSLHANGFAVKPLHQDKEPLWVAWSPFSLVQGCRLHSVQADRSMPWLRLFKVSVFHFGCTHIFGTQGDEADMERARWLADISRVIRVLTQSLYPRFTLRTQPLVGAECTANRLLAGYLILCDDTAASLVYCELHVHCNDTALIVVYEDDYCDVQITQHVVDAKTGLSERVGVDCSCFSIANSHFSARTCCEKRLWLRAITNVKVKLQHHAADPTPEELAEYRATILDYARRVEGNEADFTRTELLPRRLVSKSAYPAAWHEQDEAESDETAKRGGLLRMGSSLPAELQRTPRKPPLLDEDMVNDESAPPPEDMVHDELAPPPEDMVDAEPPPPTKEDMVDAESPPPTKEDLEQHGLVAVAKDLERHGSVAVATDRGGHPIGFSSNSSEADSPGTISYHAVV
eukprot:TRINITY_DN43348_c0_g1_i1.p1 TRINITY_DN43348_c0_g1~~TRINITY_DN43348_c0_g1_i1.p1  ORF type:complete len:481 (+),score=93.88 TRINITY_DN43348_c0_g1_i1:68-1510(+)